MTKKEAIVVLEQEQSFLMGKGTSLPILHEYKDALNMAIAALREWEERSSKRISTLEELKSYQGRCVSWNGVICSCKNGYLISDNGTFSFDWVLSHGEVYSCPIYE